MSTQPLTIAFPNNNGMLDELAYRLTHNTTHSAATDILKEWVGYFTTESKTYDRIMSDGAINVLLDDDTLTTYLIEG